MLRGRTEGIVIHRAEVYTKTDYHFVVNRDGTIKRVVPMDEKGEHAKDFNANTIGVAVFGDFAALEPGINNKVTDAQLATTVALIRTINAMYGGNLWVTGHSKLGPRSTDVPQKLAVGHTCPGENFPLDEVIKLAGCRLYLLPVTVA